MTKDEFFKLCTALVQEQVYAWVIASSFVCSWKPPRYGGRHALETELVYTQAGVYGKCVLQQNQIVFNGLTLARLLHFWNDWWKFIQILQYYTMALTMMPHIVQVGVYGDYIILKTNLIQHNRYSK